MRFFLYSLASDSFFLLSWTNLSFVLWNLKKKTDVLLFSFYVRIFNFKVIGLIYTDEINRLIFLPCHCFHLFLLTADRNIINAFFLCLLCWPKEISYFIHNLYSNKYWAKWKKKKILILYFFGQIFDKQRKFCPRQFCFSIFFGNESLSLLSNLSFFLWFIKMILPGSHIFALFV